MNGVAQTRNRIGIHGCDGKNFLPDADVLHVDVPAPTVRVIARVRSVDRSNHYNGSHLTTTP